MSFKRIILSVKTLTIPIEISADFYSCAFSKSKSSVNKKIHS